MKRLLKPVLLIAITLATIAAVVPGEKYFDIARSLDIFATLFKEVNTYYVDEVEPQKLINNGIHGMLSSLDPYTDYISEEDLEAFTIQTTGQYAGIGALIGVVNNKTVVRHPYENFPAYRAGIKVGDEFVEVDGKNMRGKSSSEVSAALKGNPKTEVEVVVKRLDKEYSFKVNREKIKISNVVYQALLDGNIGYIKMDDFTPGAAKEVEDAITDLKRKGATKLIFDLRDNPGGLLYEAVNIVNLFIPKGKEVVSTKGKLQDWNKTYTTLNAPVDTETPLVVLTSGSTASASEIVAGALQDYDRAVLVGQRTFGKGLVQTTRQLAYNTQLKVTTAKYYIPSGRCIQALDYTHRKADGTVTRIADSLKNAFKTKRGRTVYDGGGLDPDIAVAAPVAGSAVIALYNSELMFDYATRYCAEHPAIPDMTKFRLSEQEYTSFTTWLKAQNFNYTTPLENQTKALADAARKERYYDLLSPSLKSIESKLEEGHAAYLQRFKSEITQLLEEEIGFHYTLHRGRVEVSLHRDKELEQARKILADLPAFGKLLQPHE